MNKLYALVVVAALVLVGCSDEGITNTDVESDIRASSVSASKSGVDQASGATTRRYEVSIENLTTGQPLSPGVVATHTKLFHLIQQGASASEGIRAIAEGGDPSVAADELSGHPLIHQLIATDTPVHRIGGGDSLLVIEIEAAAKARQLSMALMLVCTNDGFAGLDAVKLPRGFAPLAYEVNSYDAGTEANDELSTSVVDGCGAIGPVVLEEDGNEGTATEETVALHAGIQGGADLDPAVHGWQDPVARVTIQRIQ